MSKNTIKDLPEWVKQYKTTGRVVKKNGDNYYLYRHTSRYEAGKEYPQTVDIYIGKITPEGVIPAQKHKIASSARIVVREYGNTSVLIDLCPDEWKKMNGKDWLERLRTLIVTHSPNSYLIDDGIPIRSVEELNINPGAQYSTLMRHMKDRYGVEKKDLETLEFIYRIEETPVQADLKKKNQKRVTLSFIDENQQRTLEKLNYQLEVH